MANRPLITLTTDFGLNDHFVGTMKGVILDIVPEAEIVDVCHAVQAFDVLDGALTIAHDMMTAPISVRDTDDLHTALEQILQHGVRELVVLDEEGRIAGFLDEAEITRVYHAATQTAP